MLSPHEHEGRMEGMTSACVMRELRNVRLNVSICFFKRIIPVFYISSLSLSNPERTIVRVRSLKKKNKRNRRRRERSKSENKDAKKEKNG
jgi:hypothetical protein